MNQLHDRFDLDGFYYVEGSTDFPATAKLRGEGNRPILFKEKRNYLSRDEFLAHIELQHFIFNRNGPVAEPLKWRWSLAVQGHEGALAELQAYTYGRDPDSSSSDVAEMGRTLRLLHQSAVGFQRSVLHLEPRDRFGKTQFYRQYLEASRVPESLTNALYTRAAGAKSDSIKFEKTSEFGDKQFIHGDPVPSNFLFDLTGAAVLLDLDDMHNGYRIEDFAWFLTLSCIFRRVYDHSSDYILRSSPDRLLIQAAFSGYYGNSSNWPSTELLVPWIRISLVCALIDCLMRGSEPLISVESFVETGECVCNLIDHIECDLP